jgi:hypothetical protein
MYSMELPDDYRFKVLPLKQFFRRCCAWRQICRLAIFVGAEFGSFIRAKTVTALGLEQHGRFGGKHGLDVRAVARSNRFPIRL